MTAEKVLIYLKDILEYYLEELNTVENTEFILGERTAYIECLEIIQRWKNAKEIGLNYPIEVRFPIE